MIVVPNAVPVMNRLTNVQVPFEQILSDENVTRRHKDRSWPEDAQDRGPSCIPPCASYDHPSNCRSPRRQRSDSRSTSPISAAENVRRRGHFLMNSGESEGRRSTGENTC